VGHARADDSLSSRRGRGDPLFRVKWKHLLPQEWRTRKRRGGGGRRSVIVHVRRVREATKCRGNARRGILRLRERRTNVFLWAEADFYASFSL